MILDREMVILVVDDFEPMRKVTATQLRMLGLGKVVFAANGGEALRIIENQQVDMVLSDWNMPVMNGLELLKLLRTSERYWNMPFIMITAEAERGRVREAIMAGVSDLLVKPYTPERLSGSIEKALDWKARKRTPESVFPVVKASDKGTFETSAAAVAMLGGRKADKPVILIVDDLPDNLQLLARLFKADYRVRVAQTGLKALEICHSDTPPDLVLLDVMMPEMDGFEVARRMREHPNSEMTPIIFVTAMDQPESRQKGMTLGAVDYVTKPIEPEQLTLRVRNFLRYVELHKQLQADFDLMLEMERIKEDVEHMTRHDIKGPLAGIIGLLHGLQKDGAFNARQIAQLKLVENTAMQVIDMVNLSSEIFKIEHDSFVLNPCAVDLQEVLGSVVELARATYEGKRLSIVFDTDVPLNERLPAASGDRLLCYSIFQNLVKNACEAAPDKGRIVIMLSEEESLQVAITNPGAVPLEIRNRFFDKFVSHGKPSGTGLGTYSAKLLTEAQNGHIAFSVDDAQNTTSVTVRLPRWQAS
ncbi:ATP-binding response regulator [Chitinilyticum aquatile]|uniref:ATP-binding response regulator n=1 Tax=Chitinilyticum aquatile TaxID=362520 RepID=UPI00048D5BE8|nr:response regulator [Chitinilyticum aquatile]